MLSAGTLVRGSALQLQQRPFSASYSPPHLCSGVILCHVHTPELAPMTLQCKGILFQLE